MIQTLFLIIAGLGLLMALGTVLSRNLIHAALYLVGFFALIACMFLLLEAEFLAAMQVLVYIGAVAILLLFGIMLTRNIQGGEYVPSGWAAYLPAFVVSIGLFGVLAWAISAEQGAASRPSWSSQSVRPPSSAAGPADPLPERAMTINRMPRLIGDELMTRHAVAFELAGLLLTVAVVGAVALAMRDDLTDAARPGEAYDSVAAPPPVPSETPAELASASAGT
ncbi:MAG: NADH-quinone oxidoreductase subunit J [Isosphaeraceae bacterium]